MKVIWFPNAKEVVQQTARYIRAQFGDKSCKEFLREIVHIERLLRNNPHLGAEEPLLSNLPTTYRSVVVKHLNKIVYRITDDCIEIADFWDVRREPNTLANQVE